MKKSSYCSKEELLDLLKMGVFTSECEAIAKRTPEKDWHKWLKTIETLSMKIFDQRLAALDNDQKVTVLRRYQHTAMKFFTSDQDRIRCKEDGKPEESIKVAHSDFFDVLDLAMYNCMACPQGDCREQCYWRKVYHRLGVPVSRDSIQEGECEFSLNKVGEVVEAKHRLLKIDFERERL